MKIDSHQHFWHYNTSDYGWIGGGMSVLKKDFLPNELKCEMDSIGFDGSIAVQARQSYDETEWLLKLTEKYDFIKGVVGWVDLCSPLVEDELKKYTTHKKLVGVRHVVHDEPDEEFILAEYFLNGIGLLKEYNLTYDILIFPNHLENTIKFVEKFPLQTFVLDHIAKPNIKDKKVLPWKENISQLAQFPNVFCKLSGMVTENDPKNWNKADFIPYLDVVFESFGIDRIMIGSDWPVCRLGGKYNEIMDIVFNYFNEFSKEEKDKVFGLNAMKAYNLKTEQASNHSKNL